MASIHPPSAAGAFMERLLAHGLPHAFNELSALVAAKTPETDWLDFKDGRIEKNDDALKQKWSKALSAFANTGGGALVFGIEARKNAAGEDFASAVSLVTNPSALRTRLDELLIGAVNPPVQGVRFEIIDPHGSGGFVVAYVPASDFKPHRAEYSSKHYYLRSGSHTHIIEPTVLRQMFFPRAISRIVPRIEPKIRQTTPTSHDHFHVDFAIIFRNAGTKTAREVFVVITKDIGAFQHNATDCRVVPNYVGPAFELIRPLHPGAQLPVGTCHFTSIVCRPMSGGYHIAEGATEVAFEMRIYCDDQEPIVATASFIKAQIEQQVHLEARTDVVPVL
jgi:hypothetical protein